ncbi:MAG: lipid A biosynthesis acyltransferase, partial [Edaphobacter sp.]
MSEDTQGQSRRHSSTAREWAEFCLVRTLVFCLGILPRALARALGSATGWLAFHGLGRLRKVGLRNLELAFPEKKTSEREAILRAVYRNLGRLLAEFCQMPHY